MNAPRILLILAVVAAGCGAPAKRFNPASTAPLTMTGIGAAETINPAWLKPSTAPYRLGPGDRIEIELLGQGDDTTKALVGPDGRIYFQLLPGLSVWGLTLQETRQLLEREMSHYIRNPRVSITLREVRSRRIWVLGRLNTPGVYAMDQPLTVLDAITRAGGLYSARFTGTTEELADLQHSFVMRRGRLLPVNFKKLVHQGDTSQNIYLEPDDFVYLPSALSTEVYVLGAVTRPRAISFKDEVTLSSAISSAQGFQPQAHIGGIVVVRGSLTEPSYAVVDYLKVLTGKAPDIRLQPHDIVYVPDRPFLQLEKIAALVVNTFVRTLAANEGLRAGGGVSGVQVNIPVAP